ncbi:MAG: 7-cyano-7-deazaguanine synthase QueC [Deltaproteobacteria bacterium]|nr:7-cyano-7-deazaguanine synthase QueC [Deltaproteobacteria bacterium]PWB61594.1 MAG: 7-cyano-7-deazaguanine synthase QueC [Deltaproteobacteria bacterium]
MTVPPKPKGVVLVSGGMDSLVLAAFATRESEVALLHVNYGQPTERKELACFHAIADHLKVKERLAVDIGYLKTIGGSALTDPRIAIPEADLDRGTVPATYVPFRNAHFLCIAVSWAEVIGAKNVYIGAVTADSSGYPDCRPEFYEAMNEAVRRGTKEDSGIVVRAPFVRLKKKDLVLMGKSLGVPFEHSWSCYRDGEKACGRCDSCALRLRAFAEAGVSDPIEYAVRPAS